jgi:hypothetical protein
VNARSSLSKSQPERCPWLWSMDAPLDMRARGDVLLETALQELRLGRIRVANELLARAARAFRVGECCVHPG